VKLQTIRNGRMTRPLVLAAALLLCHPALAAADDNEDPNAPSAIAMGADLVIGRPALLAATVLGTAIWIVALPFSAAGGNVKESGEKLVVWPAKNTFVRCLGCATAGYRED
jgi:hypothetical protein